MKSPEIEPLPCVPVYKLNRDLLELSDDEIYDFFAETLSEKNVNEKSIILTVLENTNTHKNETLPPRKTTFGISMQEWHDHTIHGGSTSGTPLRYIEEYDNPLIAVYDISDLEYVHLTAVSKIDATEHISTNELKHRNSPDIQDALVCVFEFEQDHEQ